MKRSGILWGKGRTTERCEKRAKPVLNKVQSVLTCVWCPLETVDKVDSLQGCRAGKYPARQPLCFSIKQTAFERRQTPCAPPRRHGLAVPPHTLPRKNRWMVRPLEAVFISENAGWARNFFASQKKIFAGILGGFQKICRRMAEKDLARWR